MATYAELFAIRADNKLLDKVTVAVAVHADAIRANASATTEQKAWAKRAFSDPKAEADKLIWAVLAANKSATVEQIEAAADATVQAAVDNVISLFAV